MITIEYCSKGLAVSDFGTPRWVQKVKNTINSNCTFKVSTSIPILALRYAIAKGEIDCSLINFNVMGNIITSDQNGIFDIPEFPVFNQTNIGCAKELFATAIEKVNV